MSVKHTMLIHAKTIAEVLWSLYSSPNHKLSRSYVGISKSNLAIYIIKIKYSIFEFIGYGMCSQIDYLAMEKWSLPPENKINRLDILPSIIQWCKQA